MAMTPKTGDPTQRRIAMFMALIFLFICYNLAAALALYYTAQNLFSICNFIRTDDNRCRSRKVAPKASGPENEAMMTPKICSTPCSVISVSLCKSRRP